MLNVGTTAARPLAPIIVVSISEIVGDLIPVTFYISNALITK
jgi:hypothetical protein